MKKRLIILAMVFIAFFGAGAIYVNDYYKADKYALSSMESTADIAVYNKEDAIVFEPSAPKAGFVLYPGGKVEYTSYSPVAKELAAAGILCIVPHMPFNLAVLDMDIAGEITAMYPDIDKWYIGGHSLGGSMAAAYIAGDNNEISGIVLLAAYSTEDISEKNIDVLSVRATEDGVLNMENYEKYYSNLPPDTQEIIIEGGCHSFFGSYGPQKGDGIPTVSVEEQTLKTADAVIDFILDK